ncbi:MAG: fasciclin domain-containing protein [Pelobium sp.]
MNFLKKNYILLLFLGVTIAFTACKKWDVHNETNEEALNENLLQEIVKNQDLSKFNEYLVKTGYDKILSSAKTFTVWAPNNAALANLDASILNDTTKLKLFVANHIAVLSYFTAEAKPSVRVRLLSKKNAIFTATTFDEATILSSDKYVGNGVLHVIDQAIVPKQSIWEYLNSSGKGELQRKELQKLSYQKRIESQSEIIGYDQITGQPIYKEGVGVLSLNKYLNTNDISSEDSLYTYIILTDQAFNDEKTKLTPYFKTDTVAVTDSLVKYNVIKDLAIRGRYDKNNLPTQLYSAKDSVVYNLDKNAIVSTYNASNGVVYVMNKLNYDKVSKIKPVIIQGESNYTLQSSKTVQIRTRRNSLDENSPLYNSYFKDLLIENHGVSGFWVKYTPLLKSVKYKVYFRAVRDFNLVPATGKTDIDYARERIAFLKNTATEIPYYEKLGAIKKSDGTFVPNYDEVYAGEYTVAKYGDTDVFLVSNNVTTNGLNTLLLDYIRLVPVP